MHYTVNIRGRLLDLATPRVMGIMNVTPDSFFAGSRQQGEQQVASRALQMAAEGAAIIDIGACSTRPDSQPATQQEEIERLRAALPVVRRVLPDMPVSVDTFRPDVARMAVEELGADIINDVGGPATTDASRTPSREPRQMLRTVSSLRVPYILMSAQPDLRTTLLTLAAEVQQLRDLGHADIIVDPGFGFGKTLEQNYRLLDELERLQELQLPVLVGLSRKSMVSRVLECQPDEALNGTTVLHTVALMKGASILRVHDVKAAAEAIALTNLLSPPAYD